MSKEGIQFQERARSADTRDGASEARYMLGLCQDQEGITPKSAMSHEPFFLSAMEKDYLRPGTQRWDAELGLARDRSWYPRTLTHRAFASPPSHF